MTRRFCLIGERAGTSLSPLMHNAAFRARGIDAVYEGFDVVPEQLPHVLAQLRSGVYSGCNVTMPYKAAVVAACDWVEGDAELLGVVNTITVEQGKLIGQNTDAEGFELALSVQGLWPVAGSTALILGAGGAAAAVALALLRAPAARMVIAARRTEPAVHLAERVAAGARVDVLPWEKAVVQPAAEGADVVVNATPAGVAELPLSVHRLPLSCTVADVRYRPRPVDLVAAATDAGLRACDGLEMLLQQGMLCFERWTGEAPPWEDARTALHTAAGA